MSNTVGKQNKHKRQQSRINKLNILLAKNAVYYLQDFDVLNTVLSDLKNVAIWNKTDVCYITVTCCISAEKKIVWWSKDPFSGGLHWKK